MNSDCLRTIWQFLYPTSEEVQWLGSKEITKQILKGDIAIKEDFSNVVR